MEGLRRHVETAKAWVKCHAARVVRKYELQYYPFQTTATPWYIQRPRSLANPKRTINAGLRNVSKAREKASMIKNTNYPQYKFIIGPDEDSLYSQAVNLSLDADMVSIVKVIRLDDQDSLVSLTVDLSVMSTSEIYFNRGPGS